MPVTTKGIPYPSGADDPDVPDDMRLMAQHIDTRLAQATHAQNVNVTASAAVSGSVAVTFPASLFSAGPRVWCQAVATVVWVASPSAVSAGGATITIRNIDNAAATATIAVNILAMAF